MEWDLLPSMKRTPQLIGKTYKLEQELYVVMSQVMPVCGNTHSWGLSQKRAKTWGEVEKSIYKVG